MSQERCLGLRNSNYKINHLTLIILIYLSIGNILLKSVCSSEILLTASHLHLTAFPLLLVYLLLEACEKRGATVKFLYAWC